MVTGDPDTFGSSGITAKRPLCIEGDAGPKFPAKINGEMIKIVSNYPVINPSHLLEGSDGSVPGWLRVVMYLMTRP